MVWMALTDDDIAKISQLIQPLRNQVSDLETSLTDFRSETLSNFDALFLRDEKRETENLLRDEQVGRVEERLNALDQKVA